MGDRCWYALIIYSTDSTLNLLIINTSLYFTLDILMLAYFVKVCFNEFKSLLIIFHLSFSLLFLLKLPISSPRCTAPQSSASTHPVWTNLN